MFHFELCSSQILHRFLLLYNLLYNTELYNSFVKLFLQPFISKDLFLVMYTIKLGTNCFAEERSIKGSSTTTAMVFGLP